jgi:hypothetical protein
MSAIDRFSTHLLNLFDRDETILDELNEHLLRRNEDDNSEYIFYCDEKITYPIKSIDNLVFINCRIEANVTCTRNIILINSASVKIIKSFNNLFVGSRSEIAITECDKAFFVISQNYGNLISLKTKQLELILPSRYRDNRNLGLIFENVICNFILLVPRQISQIHLKRNCYFKEIKFFAVNYINKVFLGESSKVAKIKNGRQLCLSDICD